MACCLVCSLSNEKFHVQVGGRYTVNTRWSIRYNVVLFNTPFIDQN